MTQPCNRVSTEPLCYFCPAVPAQATIPPVIGEGLNLGWNASAFSITRLSGDCYTAFNISLGAGIAIGLSNQRTATDPSTLEHGLLFQNINGFQLLQVIERGVPIGLPQPADPAARYRIERDRARVRFFMGSELIADRLAVTAASLVVVACLYAVGDEVQ